MAQATPGRLTNIVPETTTLAEQFQRREQLEVQDTLLDERPPKVQGRIDGLIIFVELGDSTSDIAEGDVIEAQITDHRDNCAHARLHAEVDT